MYILYFCKFDSESGLSHCLDKVNIFSNRVDTISISPNYFLNYVQLSCFTDVRILE